MNLSLDFGRVALVVLFAVVPVVLIALGFVTPGLRARGPLFVAFFAGLIPIVALYVPRRFVSGDGGMSPRLDQWLIIVAAFGCLTSAYGSGSQGVRSAFTGIFLPVLITVVIVLIFDLMHTHQGVVEISQQPMLDLQQSMQVPAAK